MKRFQQLKTAEKTDETIHKNFQMAQMKIT